MKLETRKKILLYGSNSVQIDETVIYKGKLITCPTQTHDETPGLTWLVGIIEARTGNMVIEIVPNKKIETITDVIRRNVLIESVIITDGHPSYPTAIKRCFGMHKVGNHSVGFKNAEGYHTNNIENLWSQIKYIKKKRHGVKKSNVDSFLVVFTFRYPFLRQGEYQNVGDVWHDILC